MNVILCGYGRMGLMIEQMIQASDDMNIIGVVHPGMYDSPLSVPGHADLIIDFSYPGNLTDMLARAERDGSAVVIGTTGLSDAQLGQIFEASKRIRVMHSSNYSVGVAVLKKAVAMVAPLLKDSFDMEIVETHHNKKVDAPSGTAKMLLTAIDPDGSFDHVYGREGVPGARGHEIGIHALRGGTVAGEHSVFFFGEDESLEFRHTANSRRIFAAGAIRAARWVMDRPAGLYNMDDVLND